MPAPEAEPLFQETQTFRQWWLWGMLLGLFLFIGGSFVVHWITQPEQIAAEILPGIFFLAVWLSILAFLYSLKLTVRVDRQTLHVHFRPLTRREIPLDTIASFEACTYRPILEYGGWGLRYSWKGTAYNVSGNRGVKLVLTNGKRILIGSQIPEELADAIGRARA